MDTITVVLENDDEDIVGTLVVNAWTKPEDAITERNRLAQKHPRRIYRTSTVNLNIEAY